MKSKMYHLDAVVLKFNKNFPYKNVKKQKKEKKLTSEIMDQLKLFGSLFMDLEWASS